MRTLVHLSDLHFGRVDEALLEPIVNKLHQIEPDVVVISGDLTQRARTHELKAARRFIDSLPGRHVVVPGNHDVPFHDLTRVFRPLHRYQKHVQEDLAPFYADDEIAVLGINTARGLAFINGRIDKKQVLNAQSRFARLAPGVAKIVVTHHPLDAPDARHTIVGRAALAMHAFAHAGVDMLLSGHLHLSHAGHAAEHYVVDGRHMLLAHAGTTLSTRIRGEGNAFNVITIEKSRLVVERQTWSVHDHEFRCTANDTFPRNGLAS